jgi:MiaB-like tRNA modifying enzyme
MRGMPEKGTLEPVLAALAGKRVYIETYGCRYNFGDSLKLYEILRHLGCRRAEGEEDADAVIINTCTVVAATERRMLRRLMQVKSTDLYVTGCMPEVQREAILSVCTPVFIPHAMIREQYRLVRTVPSDPVGIVQIAEGCRGACTYCITRKARGPLRSVPLPEILEQVTAYGHAGAAEIQLTAQDAGAWGQDISRQLPDLLHAIGELKGRVRVRVGMMNPATILPVLDDLVDAFAEKNLFGFIHVPVQSGSDRILRLMGRGYRRSDFERIVTRFRERFPQISVATDMIVGFPGETEEDFSQSLDLVTSLQCDKVNITRYSRRPSTPAYDLKDMPDSVKKDRSRRLQACAEAVYRKNHARFIGNTMQFIVTEQIRKGSVMARSDTYRGIVLGEDLPIGATGSAEIVQAGLYFLKGRRIGEDKETYPQPISGS